MTRFRFYALTVLLSGIVGIAILGQLRPSGIEVIVENRDPTPLKSLVLHVTGASYPLGDVPPGAVVAKRVKPTGESHLEIEFTGADGKPRRLDAGGYFEPGYRGTIRLSIRDHQIATNQQTIKLR